MHGKQAPLEPYNPAAYETDLSTPSDEGSEIPDSGEELHELGEVSDEDGVVKDGSMLVLTITADSRQRDLIKV